MQRYTIEIGGKSYVVEVDEEGGERYRVVVDGRAFGVRLTPSLDAPTITATTEIATGSGSVAPASAAHASGGAKAVLRAPMPGVVLSIAVQPGERVSVAQQLLVLEAMKMKNPISATRDGVVSEIVVQEGQSGGYNDVLLKFEEA